MGVNAELYRQQLAGLLPQGMAWPQDPASALQQVLGAFGATLAAHDQTARALVDDVFPAYTVKFIDEWERVCGLPDACTVLGSQALAERRTSVVAKLGSSGGQSRAYFIGIAKAMGYPSATITEFRPRRCGQRFNTLYGGLDWAHVWQMNLPAQKVTPRVSGSPTGERYRVWGDAVLECTINQLKPAQTLVQFKYE
jgi:uncharacterized protein YmfQ (DUF2313 family)